MLTIGCLLGALVAVQAEPKTYLVETSAGGQPQGT
jgi:hypothetical protein